MIHQPEERDTLQLLPNSMSLDPPYGSLSSYTTIAWLALRVCEFSAQPKLRISGYIRLGKYIGSIRIDPSLRYWPGSTHWEQSIIEEAVQTVLVVYFESPKASSSETNYFQRNTRSAS